MARKKKEGPSKSDSIRDVLKANPKMGAKDVVATLADKGIDVSENMVYYVKGRVKGRRGRRKKARQMVAKVATATGTTTNGDAVKTILKVKSWANEVGGLKQLKKLVDALNE
jgi:hypothetical protein